MWKSGWLYRKGRKGKSEEQVEEGEQKGQQVY